MSDTSPVRALAHLHDLALMRNPFGHVLVPPAVANQLAHPPGRMRPVDVSQHDFIRVQIPLRAEAAGRRVARRFGSPVTGTLGILLRGKQRGYVATIRALLDRLQSELGFFMSQGLRERVLRTSGESIGGSHDRSDGDN